MTGAPILGRWDGEAMWPLRRFQRQCDAEFTIGEVYQIEIIEPRYAKYEGAYHAQLHDAFRNLPDNVADQFGSVQDFRKHLLIKAGWFIENKYVLPSNRVAQQVLPVIQAGDEYAIVSISDNIITRWRARSQKRSAMKKDEFEKSSRDVLDLAASMIGVPLESLRRQGGQAA